MEKETLELKHIVGYLPWGLKVRTGGKIIRNLVIQIKSLEEVNKSILLDTLIDGFGHKPILFPLSSLTKEIEVNGKLITPIVEMLKNCICQIYGKDQIDDYSDFTTYQEDENYAVIFYNDGDRYSFSVDFETQKDFTFYVNGSSLMIDKLELFEMLYQMYFAINIPEHLYIDASTLTENPYK